MMRRCQVWLVMMAMPLFTAAGCTQSGRSLSATSPSPLSVPGGLPSGSATVTGVVGGAPGAVSSAAGVAVSVVGTLSAANVGSSGIFTLTGVHAGDVRLLFRGSGVDAILDISGVTEHEEIYVEVTLSGQTATLDAHRRATPDHRVELEGRISAVDATALTIQVAGATVSVLAQTVIRHGSTGLQFSDLSIGDLIHVKGEMVGSVVRADEIKVQNQNRGPSAEEVKGVVAGLSGSCPDLTFTVNGTGVATNSSTKFEHGACSALQNGKRVEVEGTRQANGSVLASKVELEEEEEKAQEAKLKGVVAGLSGSCPNLTFTVNGTGVATNSSTKFEHGACSAVQNGKRGEVEGIRQANGSVMAKKVEIES